jgi:putative transposase
MYKTQVNQIRGLDKKQYEILRRLCFHSARLYNYGLYNIKQTFNKTKSFLKYEQNYHDCKINENYKLLPSTIGQQTLKIVDRSFNSFFGLLKSKKTDNKDIKISEPNFLPKTGYFQLTIPSNGFQIKGNILNIGLTKSIKKETGLKGIRLPFPEHINPKHVKEIRILPKYKAKYFTLEIVYQDIVKNLKVDDKNILSIDIGLNNLATCFDLKNSRAFIINGKRIKSINYYYNKHRANLQSIKDLQKIKGETRKLFLLSRKRNNRIKDFIRKSAKYIIDYCKENNIGTIIIGHNKGWKQNINIGKKNNQNFVQIPFSYLMSCLESKCLNYEINYNEVIENHTSKCSYLDNEEIKHQDNYKGKRIKRGLFKTYTDLILNADVNGACNIARKVSGDYSVMSSDHIRGVLANPLRVNLL